MLLRTPEPGAALQLYSEVTARFTPWLRAVVGARGKCYRATDRSLTAGFDGGSEQTLFKPKGSLIRGPFRKTELYLSAAHGFHSDNARGVFGAVAEEGFPATAG